MIDIDAAVDAGVACADASMVGDDGATTEGTRAGVCICIVEGESAASPCCRGEEEKVMDCAGPSIAGGSIDAVPDHSGTAVERFPSRLMMPLLSCFRSCGYFLIGEGNDGSSSRDGGGEGSPGSGDIKSDSSVVVRLAFDRLLRRFWNQMVT